MESKTYFIIPKTRLIYSILFSALVISSGLAVLSLQPKPSSFHVAVYIQRVGELEPSLWSYHAGSLTLAGKNFIEGVLGNDAFANATHYIQFGSLSNSSTAFNNTWINIPGEITTGGLGRAEMAYASTGNGVWTMTYQWTASATNVGIQRIGMNWGSVANDGSLAWTDTITPATLNVLDKLTIIAITTVSG